MSSKEDADRDRDLVQFLDLRLPPLLDDLTVSKRKLFVLVACERVLADYNYPGRTDHLVRVLDALWSIILGDVTATADLAALRKVVDGLLPEEDEVDADIRRLAAPALCVSAAVDSFDDPTTENAAIVAEESINSADQLAAEHLRAIDAVAQECKRLEHDVRVLQQAADASRLAIQLHQDSIQARAGS